MGPWSPALIDYLATERRTMVKAGAAATTGAVADALRWLDLRPDYAPDHAMPALETGWTPLVGELDDGMDASEAPPW